MDIGHIRPNQHSYGHHFQGQNLKNINDHKIRKKKENFKKNENSEKKIPRKKETQKIFKKRKVLKEKYK